MPFSIVQYGNIAYDVIYVQHNKGAVAANAVAEPPWCGKFRLFTVMLMAFVLAAAVIPAPMIRIVFVVMAAEVAASIQGSGNESFYDLIDVSGSASDNFDANLVQRHLRTAADSAADQHFDSECVKDSGQCAMTVFAGRDHARTKQFIALGLINGDWNS